jgi:hypothetical protein
MLTVKWISRICPANIYVMLYNIRSNLALRTDIKLELPKSSRYSYKLHYESGKWRYSPAATCSAISSHYFLHCRQIGRRCCFKAYLTSIKDLTPPATAPNCIEYERSITSLTTKISNRKRNAGREYFKCKFRDKFYYFSDIRDNDPKNSPCHYGILSKMQVSFLDWKDVTIMMSIEMPKNGRLYWMRTS